LREARQQPPAPAWEKLKKAELAILAEREIAATGWLPKLLRYHRSRTVSISGGLLSFANFGRACPASHERDQR